MEPNLPIYAVVHRCEVVVLEFASFRESGKSRLFRLDVLVPVHRVQRADERTRTADLISLRVYGLELLGVAGVCKFGISKGFSVPCFAHYCRALCPD